MGNMKNIISNTKGTRILITINIVVYLISIVGVLTPEQLGIHAGSIIYLHQWYRLITNMFSHFTFMHILCNMYALFSFGVISENILGTGKYIRFYIISGVLGSTLVMLVSQILNINILAAGASGAIFSLMGLLLVLSKQLHGLGSTIATNVVITLIISSLAGGSLLCHVSGLISGIIVANIMCKHRNG